MEDFVSMTMEYKKILALGGTMTLLLMSLLFGCSKEESKAQHLINPNIIPHSTIAASSNGMPHTVTPQFIKQNVNSPAALYRKCAACHGAQGEKYALNQSQPIGQWDSQRIVSAIIGYQNGTYGGAMKTLMHNQVKELTRAQIVALSEYISHLYVKTH